MKIWKIVLGIVFIFGFAAYVSAEPLTIIDSSGNRQFVNTDTPMPSAPVQATLGSLKAAVTLYATDGTIVDITHGLYVVPVSNVPDETYLGDIKFGEAMPAGTAKIGAIRLIGNTQPDGSGTDYYALIDSSGHLQTDVLTLPAVVQSILGSLKTAATLYQTDGQIVDTTHALYIQPGTGVTFAVTGTFWQTTQPVSGTFYQTTQPVSQSVLGNLKTASTLYQTDGVPMDITHPVYTAPSTGATWDVSDTSFGATQSTLGSLKTAATLYATDGQEVDITHGLYIVPVSNVPDATYLGDIKFGEAFPTQTESTPAYQKESSQSWWTEYRYDVSTKVTAGVAVTVTKAAADGNSWIARGFSIGSFGCGHGDWVLKVNASVVAVGGFGPDAGSQGAYKFPIPIKAGNNQSIALEVTPRTSDAYILCTLYGDE